MSDVKWIKIVTDIFDDEKIKLIEALPSADTIIVIWFKLLCLAGQQNNAGVFMLNSKIAYTDEMLATIFRRDVSTVRLAITTFQNYGMVEIIDGVLTIPNWSKHQTLDAYERKKERDRLYQQERRDKQKQMIEDKKTKKSSDTSSDVSRAVGRDCSYSLSYSYNSKCNNIDNLNNLLKGNYKHSIYILNNTELLECIKEWMAYKDERTPRKEHHYTERGMKGTLTEIVNYDKDYGTKAVTKQIKHAIAMEWRGPNLNMLEGSAPKLQKQKPVEPEPASEPEMTDEEWLRMMEETYGKDV